MSHLQNLKHASTLAWLNCLYKHSCTYIITKEESATIPVDIRDTVDELILHVRLYLELDSRINSFDLFPIIFIDQVFVFLGTVAKTLDYVKLQKETPCCVIRSNN